MSTVTSAYAIGESSICAYAIGEQRHWDTPLPLNPTNVPDVVVIQQRLTCLEQAYIDLFIEYRKMRERALEAERKLIEIETGK
jgi:hypothetical protein